MSIPELRVFHLGMVVRDTEATIEMYRKALGVQNWKTRTIGTPESPIKMTYGGSDGHIAYELFEVTAPGSTMFHVFLEEHGEGVQHIGYWTPDPKAAVQAALEAGGRLMNLQADQRSTVAQVAPGDVDLDNLSRVTFVNPGLSGVRLEFVGP
ncbi:MAG TPA: VOC family protein, partial [Dehalococcoidia bacterium]|nr:VOC family protein [Dehalococcoidia bacterium]